jgi:hypothetical protein
MLAAVASLLAVVPRAGGAAECTVTVSSLAAASSAVDAAAVGDSVCLADGSYGTLSLNASKQAPGVVVRAEHPGAATIAGATLDGSYLTVAQFRVAGTFEPRPGSTGMTADHNLFVGGSYFAVMAAATTTTTVNDVSITNNRFVGRFDEDAIRLNRYHDGPDADPYGVLIEGNEFTGNVEYGGHNDVLQSVWAGDHLYFRRNYVHDFGGQGFFVKDQDTAIDGLVVEDNLIVRQSTPCDPVSLCPTWQLSPFQIFGPLGNTSIRHNTVWPGPSGGAAWLRGADWQGPTVFSENVMDSLNSDATGLTTAYSASDNTRCGGLGFPATGVSIDCDPAFIDPAHGDYRQPNGRGVTWTVADQSFGPTTNPTPPPTTPPPTNPPPPTDTTAPNTTISSGPNGPTNDATPTFAFDSDEAGATFSCRTDSGAWTDCSSPWTTTALDDGDHSVSVRAGDTAGNTDESPAERSFTVDTTAPETTITSYPPATSTSDGGSISFTVDEAGATSQCRVDTGEWADCASPYEVSGLQQGQHTVAVRSTDAAGNVESPGATASWTVDVPPGGDPGGPPPTTDAPPTAHLTAPAAGTVVDGDLRLTASADDDRGVDHIEFWSDGTRVDTDTQTPYVTRVAGDQLSAGTHTMAVRAFDASGQAASDAVTVRVRGSWTGRRSWRRSAQLASTMVGDGVTQLTGRTGANALVRVSLTLCDSADGTVADRFDLRADDSGALDTVYAGAGLCVLALEPLAG